jgi:hypothetical protein
MCKPLLKSKHIENFSRGLISPMLLLQRGFIALPHQVDIGHEMYSSKLTAVKTMALAIHEMVDIITQSSDPARECLPYSTFNIATTEFLDVI